MKEIFTFQFLPYIMDIEFFLLILSLLFFVSILTDKLSTRFGVPALLLFLLVGMIFGSDGFGIEFDNIGLAQAIGTCALCVILFTGGMSTKIEEIKPVLVPGLTLATVGVLLTTVITGLLTYFVFRWTNALSLTVASAMLLASTMSSTDSASVFSILRGKGLNLKNGIRPLLELESGSNDPMAYILTTALIGVVTAAEASSPWMLLLIVVVQLVVGTLAGMLFGKGIVELMKRIQIANDSLYPILVLTACIFIFSMTYFLQGNSYLAVYVGGLIIGNSKFVHKRSTLSFFDGLTWLMQLTMFLILGLLVVPHEMWKVVVPALIVSVIIIFVSRPISVFVCMFPFRKKYNFRSQVLVSWVGLRGAVPIILAILCKASNVPHADDFFNIVFFCTLVSLIVQGTSLPAMARRLGLADKDQSLDKPRNFDIDLPEEIKSVATEITVTDNLLQHGNRLMDMGFPQNTLVIMVRRQNSYFVPTGTSLLQSGDQLLVITDNQETLNQTYQQIEERSRTWRPQLIDDTWDFTKEYINTLKINREIRKKQRKERKNKTAK